MLFVARVGNLLFVLAREPTPGTLTAEKMERRGYPAWWYLYPGAAGVIGAVVGFARHATVLLVVGLLLVIGAAFGVLIKRQA